MKGFRWYLIKTFKSLKKASFAYNLLDTLSYIVDECNMNKKVPFESFYTFVATHKNYLKILNVDWDFVGDIESGGGTIWLCVDGFDKYLRTKNRYFINIKTQKVERCEPI